MGRMWGTKTRGRTNTRLDASLVRRGHAKIFFNLNKLTFLQYFYFQCFSTYCSLSSIYLVGGLCFEWVYCWKNFKYVFN